jgi:hypothetical protein
MIVDQGGGDADRSVGAGGNADTLRRSRFPATTASSAFASSPIPPAPKWL